MFGGWARSVRWGVGRTAISILRLPWLLHTNAIRSAAASSIIKRVAAGYPFDQGPQATYEAAASLSHQIACLVRWAGGALPERRMRDLANAAHANARDARSG